jgi:broad specificity phosphatase PhoE
MKAVMTIFLVRHAQSEFNATFKRGDADPMIFDAPLSPLGREQAKAARKSVRELEITRVIVSPMTRALQTASILFGTDFPTQVVADIREQVVHSCDIGLPPEELAKAFPHYDFDHLERCWWYNPGGGERSIAIEPAEVLQARADNYKAYLKNNGTGSVAIVSHGNFIRALSGTKPDNCGIVRLDL